jgi:trk system potassium uptake protein TrkH
LTLTRIATRAAAEPSASRRVPTAVGHVVGLTLVVAGGAMVVSAGADVLRGGTQGITLLVSGLVVGVPGAVLWSVTCTPGRIPKASIFASVLSAWIVFVLVSTIPYLATHTFTRFDNALFESVSGFTTTSATVLHPVEAAAPGILFFRAVSQWIGGISVVVFAVSVLPFLGVGVLQLAHASTIGPASEQLAPRVRATAVRLAPLYVAFTAAVAAAYDIAGMRPFDSVTHALTTVSTGGFSTHTQSFAAFNSGPIEWVGIVSMVLAGGSYALYWRALRGKPLVILQSAEFRAYLGITAAFCAATVAWRAAAAGWSATIVRRTIFTTVSITSTTGYRLSNYDGWAAAPQLLLLFAMALGAMAGSAGGGFKVGRLIAVLSYARRQIFAQLHPKAVAVVRFGREIVPELVVSRIVGFFTLFMAIGGIATLLVAAFGADIRSAIAMVASAIGNVGPARGPAGPFRDYLGVSPGARWVLMVVMLIGRLEVFPVLLGAVPLLRFVVDRLPGRVNQFLLRLGRG